MPKIESSIVDPVAAAIYAHYERKHGSELQRGYLGASAIGKTCKRSLWYSFRWAKRVSFDGRMYRLFQTGHLQEPRVVSDLRGIGCTVFDINPQTGNQYSFTEPATGHHFAGNCDGVLWGLPQAPKAMHMLEVKTASDKAFKTLQTQGVEKSKPEHFFQMQIYMHWSQASLGPQACKRALYVCVNKNTDEMYTEHLEYDKDVAQGLVDKALSIITAIEPPEKISQDASWYECKFCDYHALCHGVETPVPNCRSCAHSTPELDGHARWSCAQWQADIPVEGQRQGCQQHRYIPALLANFAKPVDSNGDDVVYELVNGLSLTNGTRFTNGDAPDALESTEIHAAVDKRALAMVANDEFVQKMRHEFGGRVAA